MSSRHLEVLLVVFDPTDVNKVTHLQDKPEETTVAYEVLVYDSEMTRAAVCICSKAVIEREGGVTTRVIVC